MNLFKYANSDYVMTCNQDDIWDINKIELTLNAMKLEDDAIPVLVATDLRVVDEKLNVLSESFLANSRMDASKTTFGYFMASCLVTGCTMMINKSLLDLLKRPCNIDKVMMHDWWASLVASCFGKVIYIPIQTISYRQHSGNSVGAVAFSVSGAIKSLKSRCSVAQDCVNQVSELIRVFPEMPSPYNEFAVLFASILNRGGYSRMTVLSRCGCWRKGFLRNLATAISFLFA